MNVHAERCDKRPRSGAPYVTVRPAEAVSLIRVVRLEARAAVEMRSGPGARPSGASRNSSGSRGQSIGRKRSLESATAIVPLPEFTVDHVVLLSRG